MAKTEKSPTAKHKTSKRSRRLKQASYRSFRLHKRIRPLTPALLPARKLFRRSVAVIWAHKKLFASLSLVYAALSLLFVRGLGLNVDVGNIQNNAHTLFSGQWAGWLTASAVLSAVIGSANGTSGSGSAYQPFLLIAVALATIWALRQVLAGKKVRMRDAFYKGMYPIIPFILVLMVIGLQLIPLGIGAWLLTTVISKLIAVTVLEKVLWFLLFLLCATLSLYMVTSSIFALLIVALPDMAPMKALRSARQLVLHRRWMVARKLLFLPTILVAIMVMVMAPFLFWLPRLAEIVYFLLTMAGWPLSIVYLYSLYRELLHD